MQQAGSWRYVLLCWMLHATQAGARYICPGFNISNPSSGTIESPEYPHKYYKDYKCRIKFRVPAHSVMTFTAGEYDMWELFNKCANWEYLKFNSQARCGKRQQNTTLFTFYSGEESDNVYVDFRSDRASHITRGYGNLFQIFYRVTSLNQTTSPPPTITSSTSALPYDTKSIVPKEKATQSGASQTTSDLGVILSIIGVIIAVVVVLVAKRRQLNCCGDVQTRCETDTEGLTWPGNRDYDWHEYESILEEIPLDQLTTCHHPPDCRELVSDDGSAHPYTIDDRFRREGDELLTHQDLQLQDAHENISDNGSAHPYTIPDFISEETVPEKQQNNEIRLLLVSWNPVYDDNLEAYQDSEDDLKFRHFEET